MMRIVLVYCALSGLIFLICRTLFGVVFLPAAKVLLSLWHSGILYEHLTATGNITRRSRISLPMAIELAARRMELKKHLRMQVLFLAVANHYDAHVFFVFNEVWRVIIQTTNSLFRI